MSEIDATPPSNESRNDPSGERRRESRRIFASKCSVNIVSPPWAITPRRLQGRAINLNNIGMKIGGIRALPAQQTAWQEAIKDDVDLKVRVEIMEQERVPVLEGRLVWVYPEDATEEGPMCSFGILFAVMPEAHRVALAGLVRDLPERF